MPSIPPIAPWMFAPGLLLAFLIYLFFSLYLYAPFAVRKQQIKQMEEEYRGIEFSELPPQLSEAFCAAAHSLQKCGFEAIGQASKGLPRTSQQSAVALWVERGTTTSAQVIGTITPSPLGGFNIATLTTFRT